MAKTELLPENNSWSFSVVILKKQIVVIVWYNGFMRYLSFEKSVGGVVYRKQGDQILFLLVQYRSWQWDFPKGHVEEGESEEQTLRREILEETKIDDLEILPNFRSSVRYFYTAKGNEKIERTARGEGIYIFKNAVYFAVKTSKQDVEIDFENKAFVWLSFDEAFKKLGNDGSRNVLSEVAEALGIEKGGMA